MPGLGEEFIIGLPDILGEDFPFFMKMMEDARQEAYPATLSPSNTLLDFSALTTTSIQIQEKDPWDLQDHLPGAILAYFSPFIYFILFTQYSTREGVFYNCFTST